MKDIFLNTNVDTRDLFPKTEANRFGKTVAITTESGHLFLGILVEDSIVIPLKIAEPANDSISLMVQLNRLTIEAKHTDQVVHKACKILGLPYFGHTNGIYADAQSFGGVIGLHLFPQGFVKNEDDFFDQVCKALGTKGIKISNVDIN